MFKNVMNEPIRELSYFTYLMRVMSGKQRVRHAHNVYNVLDKTYVCFSDARDQDGNELFGTVVRDDG